MDFSNFMSIVGFTIYGSFIFDILFIWILIIINNVLNKIAFGFKNINTYILDISSIFAYILHILYMDDFFKKQINIYFLATILITLLYAIISVNSIKDKVIFLRTLIFLIILYLIFILFYLFSNIIDINYFTILDSFILKLLLITNNICLSYNYSNSRYLKYIAIYVNIFYIIATIYCIIIAALSPDFIGLFKN